MSAPYSANPARSRAKCLVRLADNKANQSRNGEWPWLKFSPGGYGYAAGCAAALPRRSAWF